MNKTKFVLLVAISMALAFAFISCGDSKLTEKNLVGIWGEENSTGFTEFFKDGTGVTSDGKKSFSFTWKLRDSNRLQIDVQILGSQMTMMSSAELSEKGTLLTLIDEEDGKREVLRKKKEINAKQAAAEAEAEKR